MLKIQNRVEQLQNEALPSGNINVAKNQIAEQIIPAKPELTNYLWIRAPKTIVYSQAFTDGAKLLYLILLDYQGRNSYAFPSLETLARDTGKSVRRVQQILKELEAGGAIEIISQPGWVNQYRVSLPPATALIAAADSANATNTRGEREASKAISDEQSSVQEQENIATKPLELVTLLRQPVSNTTEQQSLAPMQLAASLPLQPISSELDSSELELNTVCEKSRVRHVRKYFATNPENIIGFSTATSGNKQLIRQQTISPQISSKAATAQPSLTSEQIEIYQMLQSAGVASIDAEQIALTNPRKNTVQQWVEFSKSKANPGGYLAVVLRKADAVPPIQTTANTFPVAATNSAIEAGKSQVHKNWRSNQRNQHNNREAGAVAFMQRHQSELEKWQSDQPQPISSTEETNSGNVANSEQAETASCGYVKLNETTNATSGQVKSGTSEQPVEITTTPEKLFEVIAEPLANPELTTFEPAVDGRVRSLIRQMDKQACQYLKQARIEGNKLVVSFVGNYQPTQNIANWLPLIKMNYTAVSEVLLL